MNLETYNFTAIIHGQVFELAAAALLVIAAAIGKRLLSR